MSNRATETARKLAAVLLDQAEDLASNDLTTVSTAMTTVRAAAREVEKALTDRGWGQGVLYGFGDPLDEDEDGPRRGNLDEDDRDDGVEDGDDGDFDEEGDWVAPAGTRMTHQARYDYVVVDEDAFLDYVERRAAEAGKAWTREDIVSHTPGFVMAEVYGLANMDFDGTGIVFAGGKNAVYPVPITLWEMDGETRDDHFPTAM